MPVDPHCLCLWLCINQIFCRIYNKLEVLPADCRWTQFWRPLHNYHSVLPHITPGHKFGDPLNVIFATIDNVKLLDPLATKQ